MKVLAVMGALALAGLARAQPAVPSGVPGSGPMGRLSIQVVQGTPGGMSVAGDAAEVELFQNGQSVHLLKATLDDAGRGVLDTVPVGQEVRALVRITHAGVQYQVAGPLMDTAHADETADVMVFDVTDDEPEWVLTSREATVDPQGAWVTVSETVVASNPVKLTWLGGAPDAQGRRTTVRLGIPASAQDIRLDMGFAGWSNAAFEDGTLSVQMPLMPGQTTYRFAYRIPSGSGTVNVALSAPTPTSRMVIFVPEGGVSVEPTGLGPAGTRSSERGAYRLYEGGSIGASSPVGVVLAGLAASSSPAATPASGDASSSPLVVGVGVVLGILVVGAIVALAMRGGKSPG